MLATTVLCVLAGGGLALISGVRLARAAVPSGNLLVNGDAESGAGSTNTTTESPNPIPGWTTSFNFTEHTYDPPGGTNFPTSNVSAGIGGGQQLFAGGPSSRISNATETATQTVDVSDSAAEIDAGTVTANLSADLGGYGSQDDTASITATFATASGQNGSVDLAHVTIGPVTAADRGSTTTLLPRSGTASVPPNTRLIRVTITMTKTDGGYNDGYADNVSLALKNNPPPPPPPTTPTPPPGGGSQPHALFTAFAQPFKVRGADFRFRGTVWLGGAGSTPGNGRKIVRYSWDFNGDHVPDLSCPVSEPAAVHVFVNSGTYHPILTVIDSDGSSSSMSLTVNVKGFGLRANAARSGIQIAGLAALARSAECETQLETNRPSTADCIRSFQYGLIDLNARSNNCFTVRYKFHSTSIGLVPASITGQIGGSVAVNGLAVPLPNQTITSFSSVDSKLRLGVGNINVGPVSLGGMDLDTTVPELDVHNLGAVNLSGLPSVGGLPVGGKASLDFVRPGATRLNVNVRLPNVFSMGGQPAEARLSLLADNTHPFSLDTAHISVPTMFLGPLEVDDFNLDYQSVGNVWNGTASIRLPGTESPFVLRIAPPPVDNGVGFIGGHFDHAGATLEFSPAAAPELFPGVFLTRIQFAVGTNPTRLEGSVRLSTADIVNVDGTLLLALASGEEPYTIPDGVPGLESLYGRTLDTTSLAAGGSVSFDTPIGELPLGSGYLLYQPPGYVEFGGSVHIVLGVFSLDGGAGGFADFGTHRFNLQANGSFCADGLGCLGAAGVVSSAGVAACGSIDVFLVGSVSVGAGYRWGDTFPDIYFWGCDVGPYMARDASAHGAADSTSFSVPAGVPFFETRLLGASDAPRVTLHGPRGEAYDMGGANSGFQKGFAFVRDTRAHLTHIGLKSPSPGSWTVTVDPGSSFITRVDSARGLPAPSVTGRVFGRGAKRVLSYRVKVSGSQQVTFAEQGREAYHELGHAKGSSGKIVFTPSFGRGGPRKIVALLSDNGVLVRKLNVTTFSVSFPKPSRPSRVRVSHRGTNLLISWGAASGAVRYMVRVNTSDGGRVLVVTRARRATVRGIERVFGGTVSVMGLRLDNTPGRAGTTRFAAPAQPRHTR